MTRPVTQILVIGATLPVMDTVAQLVIPHAMGTAAQIVTINAIATAVLLVMAHATVHL